MKVWFAYYIAFHCSHSPCISRSFVWYHGHKRGQSVFSPSLFIFDGFLKQAIISPKGWGIKQDSSGGGREDPFVNPSGAICEQYRSLQLVSGLRLIFLFTEATNIFKGLLHQFFDLPRNEKQMFAVKLLRTYTGARESPHSCVLICSAPCSSVPWQGMCADSEPFCGSIWGSSLHTFPHHCPCCFTPCSWSTSRLDSAAFST